MIVKKLNEIITKANRYTEKAQIKIKPALNDSERNVLVYLKDKSDELADSFADSIAQWARRQGIVPAEDTKHNELFDVDVPFFDDTKNKFFSLATITINETYVKDLVRWLQTDGAIFLK